MGILYPEVEDFKEEPKTPPGILGSKTEYNSEDDLFSDTGKTTGSAFNYEDLTFQKIIPVLPPKGVFEDYFGDYLNELYSTNDKKNSYCGKCYEDVKKDLRKLAEIVDSYKSERDAVKKENESLKQELEELKKLLKPKENYEQGNVKIQINNEGSKHFDILVKENNLKNDKIKYNKTQKEEQETKFKKILNVRNFSVSIAKDAQINPQTQLDGFKTQIEGRKSVSELKKEFQSEKTIFTSRNYLEIQPEPKRDTFRSRLNIRVKPKQKISELISKLTSQFTKTKTIPESTPIAMFQRFEKTRTVWVSELEEKIIV